ncbi:MAG: SGNH/GDSL hydrolase family protein [Candidatus Woesearchaeota archaeon]
MFGISVFGDSITFGRGDNSNRGWCGRLQTYFESKNYYNCLYNLGICGNTTQDLLQRFDTEAKARVTFIRDQDRQVILFSIGINDSRLVGEQKIPETKISDFEKNIQVLIDKAKDYTKEILFIGLTPVDESITANYEETTFTNQRIKLFNEKLKELCQKNNIPFFDMFHKFSLLNYQKLLDDGLHPNSQGYEQMYQLIKEFLIDNKIIN